MNGSLYLISLILNADIMTSLYKLEVPFLLTNMAGYNQSPKELLVWYQPLFL